MGSSKLLTDNHVESRKIIHVVNTPIEVCPENRAIVVHPSTAYKTIEKTEDHHRTDVPIMVARLDIWHRVLHQEQVEHHGHIRRHHGSRVILRHLPALMVIWRYAKIGNRMHVNDFRSCFAYNLNCNFCGARGHISDCCRKRNGSSPFYRR